MFDSFFNIHYRHLSNRYELLIATSENLYSTIGYCIVNVCKFIDISSRPNYVYNVDLHCVLGGDTIYLCELCHDTYWRTVYWVYSWIPLFSDSNWNYNSIRLLLGLVQGLQYAILSKLSTFYYWFYIFSWILFYIIICSKHGASYIYSYAVHFCRGCIVQLRASSSLANFCDY